MKSLFTMLMLLLAQWAHAQIVTAGQAGFELVAGANITFSDAQAGAASRTYMGLTGELASILSAEEQTAVQSLVATHGASCWVGGSDAAVEGEWRWQDGTQFWQGNFGGSAVGGMYNNWGAGEPNDAGGDEDGLTVGTTGLWNDYTTTLTQTCYVVRYNLALLPVPATQPLGLWLMMLAMAALGGYYLTRKAAI